MASLSFIMDVHDDGQTDSRAPPPLNKREDRGPNKPASAGPPPPYDAPSNSQPDLRHASSPDPASAEQDINLDVPAAGLTKGGGASSRGSKSSHATAAPGAQPGTETPTPHPVTVAVAVASATLSTSSTSPSPSASTTTPRQSSRFRSTTSADSMDRPRYGPPPSSSSMGLGSLQRPMSLHHPPTTQFTPKTTPKTGRVSKAKKGLPVHICDTCNPPKTFTRAEHLRRHQLGHGKPHFQCSSCDRSFHRADLLTRHQQKHETDGDDVSSRLGSAQQTPYQSPAALSFQTQPSSVASGTGPLASPSETEIPPTPNHAPGSHPGFTDGNNAAMLRMAPRSSSQDFHSASASYTLSPIISIVNPTHSPSITGQHQSNMGDCQPRTGQPPIYVVTQLPSLHQSNDVPELHDASPLHSSASDSTYSTPVSEVARNPRWVRGLRSPTDWSSSQRLSPYPGSAPRGLQSSGPGMDEIPALQTPLLMSSYSSPQPPDHTFHGASLNLPSSVAYSAAATSHYHHPSLSASSNATFRPQQHRHSNSLSSVRSRTPPAAGSSHGSETLLVSAPGLSSHLITVASTDRRKRPMVDAHDDMLGPHGHLSSLDVLGGLATEYGGSSSAASPCADSVSHSSSGIVPVLTLSLGGGCSMPERPSLISTLPGPIRAALPRYLDIYWKMADPCLPLIHRQLIHNTVQEDVLRFAMAAVATQHLGSGEDRLRGNQLHELAWQELKRTPQWNLQTLQAILLCEYFARFRGRKVLTRASKPFESLYSRVSTLRSALLDHGMLAPEQQSMAVQERWQRWIDTESRRRLFVACFFSDGHAAIYMQQGRAVDIDALPPIPLLGRSTKLWEASSAEEWANTLAADPRAIEAEIMPPFESLTRQDVDRRPAIDRITILSVLEHRLPRRQRTPPTASLPIYSSLSPEMSPHAQHLRSQFNSEQQPSFLLHHHQHHHQHHPQGHHHAQQPNSQPGSPHFYPCDAEERITTLFPTCPVANTYLALHHTPLHDLLAVAGDTWVFTQKVVVANSFDEQQARLKLWATSSAPPDPSGLPLPDVIRATVHAARAILGFLDRQLPPYPPSPPRHQHPQNSPYLPQPCPPPAWLGDMSDYWAMYVCALICWAFSHPVWGADAPALHVSVKHPSIGAGSRGGTASSPAFGVGLGVMAPSPAPSASSLSTPSAAAAVAALEDDEVLAWLRMVADEGMRPEDVVRARGRREAAGVTGLVKRRLDSDCLSKGSGLYVDAVTVLGRVEDSIGVKWF
ncbi:hypothetical protein C8A05DRAFT_11542 [Staphylotrichum tortipilum]|uniref:C2H2-type domain-containing protein n=1 Tax=Staphylotrichum tortipilum TaxID=2831512 RepID=A0AAN6RXT4_9PEZI|nr:hypothetical protein C8A05DRAFT_11542 [Staphylotrichum longicolle]